MKHEHNHKRAIIIMLLISLVIIDKSAKIQGKKSNDFHPLQEIKRFCNKFGFDKKCYDVSLIRPVVAFTAILTHTVTLGDKSAVIYNKVLTNIGNGYNAHTGHFTVPVSGLYSISASMMGDPSNSIHLNLVRNGKELVRLYTQGGRHTVASHTINIPLKKGDHLWVQQRLRSGKKLYSAGEKFNVFTATLLRHGNFE